MIAIILAIFVLCYDSDRFRIFLKCYDSNDFGLFCVIVMVWAIFGGCYIVYFLVEVIYL